jgi:hypothetical protein
MSAFPGPANPIFYSQFRIRGGWKTIISVAVLYGLVIGGLIGLSAHETRPMAYSSAMFGWLDVLLALQVFFLLIFGSARVSGAVRNDVTGKIIESHRLMPLSAFSAIIGYITGAPVQALSLALVNVIIGLFAAESAGFALERWITANAMLAAFALFLWAITVQLAFAIRGGFLLVVIALAIAVFSSGTTMVLLPALSVLTCPLLGRSVFNLQASLTDITFPFVAALLSQFILGMIFIAAAMRKYRLPDAAGFNAPLGLLLLAAWTATSLLGMVFLKEFVPPYFFRDMSNIELTQFIATIVASMLLAIVPIASSARANRDYHRDRIAGSIRRPPLSTWITTLLAFALICAFLKFPPPTQALEKSTLIQTALILLASLGSLALLFRWGYLVTSKLWIIAVIWLVLLWILPLVGDAIHRAFSIQQDSSLGIVATLSPIGALILTWDNRKISAVPGIAFQFAMALLPATLYFNTARRIARKTNTPAPQDAGP